MTSSARAVIARVFVLDFALETITIKPNLKNQSLFLLGTKMARPRAKELTERELEVMQAFWDCGEATIADVRDEMAEQGRDLAYTTVATLVRILLDKGFLTQCNEERPYTYLPTRSFEEVTGNMLSDMLERVFRGSREKLLLRLLGQQKLTAKERAVLEQILRESKK